ncbi:hypothetical protein [Macrococcus brunensis]|uniref:hypothetical protein n=1 Tax=Macrococcus brunensis TaxID=198483 RepID=UPI001EF0558C|nr:hypothetical protein [Macrococcus brunensis]ULG73003.1 hypothetical protein MGG12_05660 [Macrococcus brunensis]
MNYMTTGQVFRLIYSVSDLLKAGDQVMYDSEVYEVTQVILENNLPAYVAVDGLEMCLFVDEIEIVKGVVE